MNGDSKFGLSITTDLVYYGTELIELAKESLIKAVNEDSDNTDTDKELYIESIENGTLDLKNEDELLSVATLKVLQKPNYYIEDFNFPNFNGTYFDFIDYTLDIYDGMFIYHLRFKAVIYSENLINGFKELEELEEASDFTTHHIDFYLSDVTDNTGGSLRITGESREDMRELINLVSQKDLTYEQFYFVHELGIEIGARTVLKRFSKFPKNRIVLRKDRLESYIDCVHTAFVSGTLEEFGESINREKDLDFLIESSEGSIIGTDILDIDQHFFALKSFVQGIVEVGLLKMIRESYNHSSKNYGFNDAMHSQLISALTELDGDLAREVIESFMLDVLSSMRFPIAKRWLLKAREVICGRFNMIGFRVVDKYEVKVYITGTDFKNDFNKYFYSLGKSVNQYCLEAKIDGEPSIKKAMNHFVGYDLV